MSERRYIPGYEVDVYRATWERRQSMGAPRCWSVPWFLLAVYLVLFQLYYGSVVRLAAVVLMWFVGQGILAALTRWDPDWDRIFFQWLGRCVGCRNPRYLRAG